MRRALDPRVPIRAVVSQAGVLDLTLAAGLMPVVDADAGSARRSRRATTSATCSPRRASACRSAIPQLVLHGERDDTVSMRIATSYASGRRERRATPASSVVLSHTGHFEHIDAGSEAWHVARDWLVAHSSAARS